MNGTAPDAEQGSSEPRTLAAKVEWLIENMWPPGRPASKTKTNEDVAKAVKEATGEDLTRSTIWKLRAGKNDNPTLKTMKALRVFFRLPSIGYFDDGEGAELEADDAALLALLRDDGVGRPALRALTELSSDGQATVADMIQSISRRERQRAKGGGSGSQAG